MNLKNKIKNINKIKLYLHLSVTLIVIIGAFFHLNFIYTKVYKPILKPNEVNLNTNDTKIIGIDMPRFNRAIEVINEKQKNNRKEIKNIF